MVSCKVNENICGLPYLQKEPSLCIDPALIFQVWVWF